MRNERNKTHGLSAKAAIDESDNTVEQMIKLNRHCCPILFAGILIMEEEEMVTRMEVIM